MPITIKDIARLAEVSHSTVSRALHRSPLVDEGTAERIRRIALEAGYLPSAAARSLKTNRSQALGVILSSVDDPFFGEILQGIEEVAQNRGYSLFIAASQRDPERERAARPQPAQRISGAAAAQPAFPQLNATDRPACGPHLAHQRWRAHRVFWRIFVVDAAPP